MTTAVINTESQWFKIAVLIIAIIIIIVCAYNVNGYRKILSSNKNAVTNSEINTLLIINAVFMVLGIVLFIWALWRLVFSAEYREYIIEGTKNKVTSVATQTNTGLNFKPTTTTPVPATPVPTTATGLAKPVASTAAVPHAAVAPISPLRPLSPIYSAGHVI